MIWPGGELKVSYKSVPLLILHKWRITINKLYLKQIEWIILDSMNNTSRVTDNLEKNIIHYAFYCIRVGVD